EAARRLRSLDFGLARILAGEKVPTYLKWTWFSLEPADFACYPNANLSILTGRLSGDLVVVDADNRKIRKAAGRRLPPTMSDGRLSTGPPPFFSRTPELPPGASAGDPVAGATGGPGIMHFSPQQGKEKLPIGLDFLGPGAQVVCPPSLHKSG